MVKILVRDNDCDAQVQGSFEDIIVEVAIGIGAVYNTFGAEAGKERADCFRIGLMAALEEDSPIWLPRDGMVVIDKNAKMSDTPTDQS